MVELYLKFTHWKLRQNLRGNRNCLGVGNHGSVVSSDVKVALIKLSVPTSTQLGLISPIHLRDVIPFDVAHAIHSEVSRKGYG